jgi:UPF0176 protein
MITGMGEVGQFQIITFYQFKKLLEIGDLPSIKEQLKELMRETGVRGTIIIADEGFNSTVCGTREQVNAFVPAIEKIFDTNLVYKSSFHDAAPLRKIDVKIRPEIVTLKKQVDIGLGVGTHVPARQWNEIIADKDTLVLDTRNDYEFRNGTFRGAINPGTAKFSDLPQFVADNLDPSKHKRVAMFCTGGIRCEKFAPYMKQLGFESIFQLEGGILKYLEETAAEDSLWEGECFVFDERRTVDQRLQKGEGPDYSLRGQNKRRR